MPDFRAYHPVAETDPADIALGADESHHLVTVNRARAGDPVVVFNGRGREWDCVLQRPDKRQAVLAVRASRQGPVLPYHLTLLQALPKGPAMDAIVRKATEIGVAAIVPLETARTQVHFEEGRSDKKLEKWQAAALEACKQCGNPWLPQVAPVQTLHAYVETSSDADLRLLASLHPGARSLKSVLAEYEASHGAPPHRVEWLVGPEGDLSPEEVAHVQHHGFQPVTLGPLVLRCETAATYALSILSYELQNRASAAP